MNSIDLNSFYLDNKYVKKAMKDSKYIDALISGSRFRTECFERNFWYTGKIYNYGTPRNDVFFEDNYNQYVNIVKKKLNIPNNFNIILYAPTFRKNVNINFISLFDVDLLVNTLTKKFGSNWKLVVKFHPNMIINNLPNNIIYVSNEINIQHLLIASDFLITDYSSLMFDYGLLNRKIILFAPDYQEYVKNDRKLYFDINKLPFKLVTSFFDLIKSIEEFDMEKYLLNVKQFYFEIGTFESGVACKKVVDLIERNLK